MAEAERARRVRLGSGITAALDRVVQQAAEALAAAYGVDIEIRFNSDRESGGAWLRTPDGGNADVGICASLVTARARRQWACSAAEAEAEAGTGRARWQSSPLSESQRDGARGMAVYWRDLLERHPEGELTVLAHIRGGAVSGPRRAAELVQLNGWNGRQADRVKGGYHHGPAKSVNGALTRCLRFVPKETVTSS